MKMGEIKKENEIEIEEEYKKKWSKMEELENKRGEMEMENECMNNEKDYGGIIIIEN
jgi:hypothetical protein